MSFAKFVFSMGFTLACAVSSTELANARSLMKTPTDRPIHQIMGIERTSTETQVKQGDSTATQLVDVVRIKFKNSYNPYCTQSEPKLKFTVTKKPVFRNNAVFARGVISVSLVDRFIKSLDSRCIEPSFPIKTLDVPLWDNTALGDSLTTQIYKATKISYRNSWFNNRMTYELHFEFKSDLNGFSLHQ